MKVFSELFRLFLLRLYTHARERLSLTIGKAAYRKASLSLSQCVRLALILFFFIAPSYAQVNEASVVVSGVIKDSHGDVLPGASVVVKGTQNSVVADAKGAYSIRVAGSESVLSFKFLGMDTKDVKVGANGIINVVMTETNSKLDEVVVIGYGTTTRRDLTGAVGQVKMSDVEKAPVKSIDEALAGRIAGLTIGTKDGQPGSNTTTVIRGAGTLTQDPSPLYVIDGFPSDDANSNSINPADIESIEVLKDASATAIYGARGANGVIMITTKRGKVGETVINYNGYFGLSKNPNPMKLMNAYEFVKYQYELSEEYTKNAYLNKYITEGFSQEEAIEQYRNVPSIDMQDDIFGNAPTHNHELSFRGGSGNTTYSLSGNIIDQAGLIVNSGFKRYQGRVSLDQKLGKKVKIGSNLNYASATTYGAIASETAHKFTYSSLALMYSVWGFRPVAGNNEVIIDDVIDPLSAEGDLRVHPIISAKNELRETIVNSLSANAFVDISITPKITFRSSGGISNAMVNRNNFFNSRTANGNRRRVELANGSVIFNKINSWSNSNILTYKNTFNKAHNVTVMGGFTMQAQNNGYFGLEGQQVLNEDLGIDGLDESETAINFSNQTSWTMASFLGRANYNYRSKYYATVSFRQDGSSKFAPGKRWGFFPSADVSWRMKEEAFLKDVRFVNEAKLRISHGASGNNRVSDFPYMSQLTVPRFGGYSFNNSVPVRGSILSSYGNPDLVWETTVQSNIGYDLSLFRNRISVTADVYRKTTKDLLIEAELPFSTGLYNINNRATAYKNVGKLRNQGLELTLNTINIDKRNFKWSSNFNISFNQNKIMELYEDIPSLTNQVAFDSNFSNTPSYISPINQSAGQMYGLIWDGVYQYDDFDLVAGAYELKGNITTNGQQNVKPGDIKYKDLNGDYKIDLSDFTVIGRGVPIHVGGFTNNFSYKGFDLNVLFQWSYGNDIINANRLIFEGNARNFRALNQFSTYADRWTPENPSNTLFATGGQRDTYFSSRVIEDGSFLRLKTVALGYNFENSFLKRIKLKSLRAYVSSQNLYTWTKYSGSNPDVSTRHSVLTPGFDFASYPLPRTIVFGISTSL